MKARILIADDDLHMVAFMEQYLIEAGYQVITAADGNEAVRLAGEEPDIILLNIMLPGMEGQALFKAIREKTPCPILFFVAQNTVPDEDNLLDLFPIKEEDFILKPFSVAELEARLERRKQPQTVKKLSESFALSYLWLLRLDKQIFDRFAKHNRPPIWEKLMVLATRLGDGGLVWIIFTLALLLSPGHRKYALVCMASALTCSFIANILIKKVVARTRPFLHYWPRIALRINRPPGSSFPSGHAAVSFAAAGILAQINPLIALAAYAMAALIAFSRLYLLVHYPSDILAGAILGLLCAMAFLPLLA